MRCSHAYPFEANWTGSLKAVRDLASAVRVESGIVNDANALVSDLFLIFDNAMIYNVCPRSGLETSSPPHVEPTKTMPNGRRVVQTITRWRTRSRKQPDHSIRRPLHTVSTIQAPDVVLESPAILSGSNSRFKPLCCTVVQQVVGRTQSVEVCRCNFYTTRGKHC